MIDIRVIDRELISEFKPRRPETGHKNTFGTALICAGSRYMTGAAVMAVGSALRSGAGLVKIFSEERTLNAVSSLEPCAILEERPDKTADLLRKTASLCKTSDSVLIGSGIPRDYTDMEVLTTVILKEAKSVVMDAGALSGEPDCQNRLEECLKAREVPAVLTPHVGEFARMIGIASSEVSGNADELVLDFASRNNCVTVLKSYKTLIATPDGKLYLHDASNSGLAKGGSGDVLAGLIAGLLAQGMEPHKAACSAVYIHSKAGEAAAEDIGKRAMLPSDLALYLADGYQSAGWSEDNE
ncbi:MAG: NAD(P)H-hydrate dehydratase [Saccharofermentans sp.]|nr:NAD(P)H-hydrate dehydratase [Saccharofermentans sp.]